MRIAWAAFLTTVPVAVAACFWLPGRQTAAASPTMLTLMALAGSLWIGFTAERDARLRLERAKRAFAVHGDRRLLLGNHWQVYLVVLVRLEVVAALGLVTAVWGLGPWVGVWFVLLAGLLIALSWPTGRKARLLVERGEELRRVR